MLKLSNLSLASLLFISVNLSHAANMPADDVSEKLRRVIDRTTQLCDDYNDFLVGLKDLPQGVQLMRSTYELLNNAGDAYLEFPENKLAEVEDYLLGKVPDDFVINFGKSSSSREEAMMRTYTLYKPLPLTGNKLDAIFANMDSMNNPRPIVALTMADLLRLEEFSIDCLKYAQNYIAEHGLSDD